MPDPSDLQPLPVRHVAVVGTGLIGGSWALGLKRFAPHVRVTASDRPDVLAALTARGGCDDAEPDATLAVRNADLVVLATPLLHLPDVLRRIAPHVRPDALVTDAGSVKAGICALGAEVLSGRFVGGHPMAGSEHAGVAHASPTLFKHAAYPLCPPANLPPRYAALVRLIRALGAHVLELSPEAHDRAAALVSHVPQLAATALAGQLDDAAASDPAARLLAAGGFRDLTRIASSPYPTWEGILSANAPAIDAALGALIERLQRLRTLVQHDDRSALASAFEGAAAARASLPERQPTPSATAQNEAGARAVSSNARAPERPIGADQVAG
jgi:prephenate dehydrogenase